VGKLAGVEPRAAEPELRTPRALLRHWRDDDREGFAELNADPEVMEHFPSVLTRAESDALVDRIMAGMTERGWGLWAVELTATGAFCGFVGLNPVSFDAPFAPAVEIGWRLARSCWGKGIATEAARAVLSCAFGTLGLEEVVSFTSTTNLRSQRVMEKLGMHHDPADDFDHPGFPPGHHLRRHVLDRAAPMRAKPGAGHLMRTQESRSAVTDPWGGPGRRYYGRAG
jgi:ribosomal-protein-alanine N-acetyltransferase